MYPLANNIIEQNNFYESGLPGGDALERDTEWILPPPFENYNVMRFTDPICIWLSQDAKNNIVRRNIFPPGTGLANQTFDDDIDNINNNVIQE
jgi:hypothetical protein